MKQYLDILSQCWVSLLVISGVAYLLGSFNTSLVYTKWILGTDVRESGSGNAGLTNILRSEGKKAAIITVVGDLAKSIIAVNLGRVIIVAMNANYVGSNLEIVGAYLAGLFCIIGHLFPLYFKFRGGKGVLATLGMMLALEWKVALICLGIFAIVVLTTKMVSLGSVCGATTLPIVTFLFQWVNPKVTIGDTIFATLMTVIIWIIILAKHKDNIRRVFAGEERKLSFSKKDKDDPKSN